MNIWVNIIVVLQLGILTSCTVENDIDISDGLSYSTVGDIEDAETKEGQEQQVAVESVSEEEASGRESQEAVSTGENAAVAAENGETTSEAESTTSTTEEETIYVEGLIDYESIEEIITRTDSAGTSENTETTDIASPINIPITDATFKSYRRSLESRDRTEEDKFETKILVAAELKSPECELKKFFAKARPDGYFSIKVFDKSFIKDRTLAVKIFIVEKGEKSKLEKVTRPVLLGVIKDIKQIEKIPFDEFKANTKLNLGNIRFENGIPYSDKHFDEDNIETKAR